MILWIALLILVVVTSYILALRSMKDFTVIPSFNKYGLFLIREKQGLNEQTLNFIYNELTRLNLSISFERLFKGKESALVVYGPRSLLTKLAGILNLLELEDYTGVSNESRVWEIGIKKSTSEVSDKTLPNLSSEEQLWWQVILWIGKDKLFRAQIRTVIVSFDSLKRKNLTQVLSSLPSPNLVKLPTAFSNTQLLDFYKKRSYQRLDKDSALDSKQIFRLLWL